MFVPELPNLHYQGLCVTTYIFISHIYVTHMDHAHGAQLVQARLTALRKACTYELNNTAVCTSIDTQCSFSMHRNA